MQKKEHKEARIDIRVNDKDKRIIKEQAHKLGMNLSEFILQMAKNGKIIVIEEGKFLAQELYKFNEKLNELEKCPILFVQDVREILSQAVSDINTKIKNLKEENQKLYVRSSTNCEIMTPPFSITKEIKRRDY